MGGERDEGERRSFFCIALGRNTTRGREREVNGISSLTGCTSENKTRTFLCLFFLVFFSFVLLYQLTRNANLSVNPSRSACMCELSHWCSGAPLSFEWVP